MEIEGIEDNKKKLLQMFIDLMIENDLNSNDGNFEKEKKILQKRLNDEDENFFFINIEGYEEENKNLRDIFNTNNSNKVNKRIKTLRLFEDFLKNYKECFKEILECNMKKEKEGKEMEIQEIDDEELYKEPDFDLKPNFVCYKKSGKNIVVKKVVFDNKNLSYSPEEYSNRDMLAQKETIEESNLQRYERFYQKYKNYLDNQELFCKKFDNVRELNSEVVFIGRVIFFQSDLKAKDNYVVFVECLTEEGFDYLTVSFKELDEFFIFSNQMLILKVQKKAKIYIVNTIINTLEFTNTQIENLNQEKIENPVSLKSNIKLLIIRGPFYQKNVDFENIRSTLKQIITKNTISLMIILGPVIDYRRKDYPEESSYNEIEKNFFEMVIDDLAPICKYIYIPDKNELTNVFNIPVNKHENNLVQSAPNPSILKIGSFSFACSTFDLLDELILKSKNKLDSKKKQKNQDQEILINGLSALLESRNLAPVYGEETKTDIWWYNKMDFFEQPDVFFLNSENHENFIHQVKNCFFINFRPFLKKDRFGEFVLIGLEEGKEKNMSFEIFENN